MVRLQTTERLSLRRRRARRLPHRMLHHRQAHDKQAIVALGLILTVRLSHVGSAHVRCSNSMVVTALWYLHTVSVRNAMRLRVMQGTCDRVLPWGPNQFSSERSLHVNMHTGLHYFLKSSYSRRGSSKPVIVLLPLLQVLSHQRSPGRPQPGPRSRSPEFRSSRLAASQLDPYAGAQQGAY